MKQLIKLNLLVFLFYLAFHFLGNFEAFFVFRLLRSLVSIFAVFVLPGMNLSIIFQCLLKKKLSALESLSFSVIVSLLLVPLVLSIEFNTFNLLSAQLPLINSVSIFAMTIAVRFYRRKETEFKFDFISDFKLIFEKFSSFQNLWIEIIYLASIFLIVTAYYALPDLDPYYWVSTYTQYLSQGSLPDITGYRPLFSPLIYILNQSSQIDLYAIFKYVLPFFAILTIIPALLVAEKFPSKIQRTLILFSVFVNASTFLYLQLPIPQSTMLVCTFYFLFFMIYSWIISEETFYYIAGAIALLSYFYHESSLLIFIIWLAFMLIFKAKYILKKINENIFSFFLILIIFLLNILPILKSSFLFLFSWTRLLISKILSPETNFLFPAQYVNVDGNPMGWAGLLGVSKYYTYYVGFFSIFLIAVFIYFIFKNKEFRHFFKIQLLENKEFLTIFSSFLLFFSISEIFPRFLNIALLPERSWNFAGIFSIIFLILIFKFFKNRLRVVYLILFIGILLNIGGSIYINSLKKYTVTNDQLLSAEWIRKNLPAERIFISYENSNLLKLHAQSEFFMASSWDFYFDENTAEKVVTDLKNYNTRLNREFQDCLSESENINSEFKKTDLAEKDRALTLANKSEDNSKKISDFFSIDKKRYDEEALKNIFIYYSEIDSRNPYLKRPYIAKIEKAKDFVFDDHPDKFKRIFSNKENTIIIWKVL